MYKYTLIVSQYYYSRHFFIVRHGDDFLERARKFTAELISYKRDPERTREIYLGDLDPKYASGAPRKRYNVNDSGDIYFIQSEQVNSLWYEMQEYDEYSNQEKRGFKSNRVTESVSAHHKFSKVDEIVRKHFEIA